jgi:hypothetical protein
MKRYEGSDNGAVGATAPGNEIISKTKSVNRKPLPPLLHKSTFDGRYTVNRNNDQQR